MELNLYQRHEELSQKHGALPIIQTATVLGATRQSASRRPLGEREMEFIFSTGGVKRDGIEVVQTGWQLEQFRQIPLAPWMHDIEEILGNVTDVWVQRGNQSVATHLRGIIDFMDEEKAPRNAHVFPMFRDGNLKAVSVRFRAASSADVQQIPAEELVGQDVPEWVIKWDEGLRFLRSVLIETSLVTLPMDRDAVKQRGVVAGDSLPGDMMRSMLAQEIDPEERLSGQCEYEGKVHPLLIMDGSPMKTDVERAYVDFKPEASRATTDEPASTTEPARSDDAPSPAAAETSSNVITTNSHGLRKASSEEAWSTSGARTAIARWASEDGSGDPTKIDVSKFRKAFAYHDAENPGDLAGYRLLHHDVADGKLVHSVQGLRAAAQKIQQGASGIPADDVDAVREHLAEELRHLGQEVPWETAQGKTYEMAHEELRSDNSDSDTNFFQDLAVTAGEATYGETRLREAWELDADDAECTDPVLRDMAIRLRSSLALIVSDAAERSEVVGACVADLQEPLRAHNETVAWCERVFAEIERITGLRFQVGNEDLFRDAISSIDEVWNEEGDRQRAEPTSTAADEPSAEELEAFESRLANLRARVAGEEEPTRQDDDDASRSDDTDDDSEPARVDDPVAGTLLDALNSKISASA